MPVAGTPSASLLWPPPRSWDGAGRPWAPGAEVGLRLETASRDTALVRTAAAKLRRELARGRIDLVGDESSRATDIRLQTAEGSDLAAQGYRLEVGEKGVVVRGGGETGLLHGVMTLVQWLRLHARPGGRPEVGALRVEDAPDFPRRGVLLDVSRDKVPRMETLFELVDLLAEWKVNQLQLYTEHTFAYRGHERVWQGVSPVTPAEARSLDAFCLARGIELVANQNSLGHLHRWLVHEPYRRLAECPEGVEHAWSAKREPFSLCPVDPASLALLADLYDQLLPNFNSRQLNVGLDETFDLGRGRSAAACAERGVGRVYLEFLQQVHRLAAERGRRIQFWGDIVLEHPELVGELPQDAVVLEWGYEADHPFDEHAHLFARSGLELYVCPGTSSWNSLGGRIDNARRNLARAAVAGHRVEAAGYLVTDWGDNGHLQPLPVSYPGLLLGAGFAWSTAAAARQEDVDLPALLDVHAFRDGVGVTGRAVCELGNAHLAAGGRLRNGTALFFLLLEAAKALGESRAEAVSRAGLAEAEARLAGVVEALGGARLARADGPWVVEELRWAAEMLGFACRLGQQRLEVGGERPLVSLPPALRRGMAGELEDRVRQHRHLWRRRNRPGGLDDSAARLERVAALLRG